MLFSAVVVISCLVSSVRSSVDIEDNVILSEDSLQDLLTRTKKSPDIFFGQKKNWNKDDKKTNARSSFVSEEESKVQQNPGLSDSDEVSAEITAVLVKDIQRKLNDLEQLENSYKILKSNSSKIERTDKIKPEIDDSINSNIRSFLESKLSDDKILDKEESVRIARQYSQDPQQYQAFYGKGMSSENAYSDNGRFHGPSDSSMNMYGDRGDPYLAQYNPAARTYGAAGIEGYAYGGGKEKKEHQNPLKPLKQLKQIIPNVINALAEITTPVKPSQNTVKPEYHAVPTYPVKKPEYSVHRPTSALHAPAKHEHKLKGISTSPIFFSKQLIFGIGTDKKLDTKHYGNSYGNSEYSYPSYSYYPSGYSYYSPSSYWGPLRDDYSTALNPYPEGTPYYPTIYSLSPDAQNIYDPSLSPYTQGNAYIETPNSQVKTYPAADSNFRSVAFRANEEAPLNKNEKLINHLDSSPHRLQNLTLDEIESEIKKEKVIIQKIKERVENTSPKEEKETQLSNNVKLNSTIFRRSADNEENDNGKNKVNKLCYNGNVDENTGAFNFVEIAC